MYVGAPFGDHLGPPTQSGVAFPGHIPAISLVHAAKGKKQQRLHN